MSDNRRFSRIPFKVRTELTVEETVYTADKIENLSVGGCFLPIATDLRTGTPCTVNILLEGAADELQVMIEGEIVRSAPEGVAVQFIRIDPDSLFHLHNIIRFNAPDADAIEEEIHRHPGLK